MTARLRILNLLRTSPPLLASQIAWKLGMKPESVWANLGAMRREGLLAKGKVYHPTAVLRMGWQIIRVSQVFWTTFDRRLELRGHVYVETGVGWRQIHRQRQREKSLRRRRPITDDMVQMVQDIRNAQRSFALA